MTQQIQQVMASAIEKRRPLIQEPYETAFRLINGFLENLPHIIVDVFAKTVVFHDYTEDDQLANYLVPIIRENLPWITSCIIKKRRSKKANKQSGRVIFGDSYDTKIKENGVWYSISLTMNQDASFYLDTRELRVWMKANMKGKSVLNTFAYTGSMGIAALAGGASEVIQLDLNRQFLAVAKRSAKLNGYSRPESHYQTADFWSRVSHYKLIGKCFDCVVLDPPVYSKTPKGTIDVAKNYHKLINKVRPIITHGGSLITINNALFQSGQDHHNALLSLCADGYLQIETILSVPSDCIGAAKTPMNGLPEDPSPYNHSTKITVLRVTKKEG